MPMSKVFVVAGFGTDGSGTTCVTCTPGTYAPGGTYAACLACALVLANSNSPAGATSAAACGECYVLTTLLGDSHALMIVRSMLGL
jgi:hypothetical protein